MKIILSKYAGFCGGVKRAYEMVSSLQVTKAKKPVCVLGHLVHNADVNKKIKKIGIKEIDYDFFLAAKPGQIGTVIITAHGIGPEVYSIAKKKNIAIIDATCPKVIKVQRLAQIFSKRGYKIIIIGDKNHKEVIGIAKWAEKKVSFVSDENDLKKLKFSKKEKIAVLSQTTQNEDFWEKAADFIKNKFSQAEIISTICKTTSERQEEIKIIAGEADAVVVIGSPESANSSRLFEIAKAQNPKTYFIENTKKLRKEWFKNAKKIGISAGASAPDWIIQEVVKKLEKIC